MIVKESDFKVFKKNALTKVDKSKIQQIDEKIQSLCKTINQRSDMFTLSSCSGRISILKNSSNGKMQSIYIFTSHDTINKQEILNSLNNYNDDEELYFMQEAMIMHICVNSLKLANKLINTAKECGLNQNGIISSKKKIVVEVICDARIELPIYEKELLFSENYLEKIIKKANQNQEKSWETINTFNKNINKI